MQKRIENIYGDFYYIHNINNYINSEEFGVELNNISAEIGTSARILGYLKGPKRLQVEIMESGGPNHGRVLLSPHRINEYLSSSMSEIEKYKEIYKIAQQKNIKSISVDFTFTEINPYIN
jgi:hypothetical protein